MTHAWEFSGEMQNMLMLLLLQIVTNDDDSDDDDDDDNVRLSEIEFGEAEGMSSNLSRNTHPLHILGANVFSHSDFMPLYCSRQRFWATLTTGYFKQMCSLEARTVS